MVASGHSELAELFMHHWIIGWDQAEVGRIAAGMLLDRIRNGGSHEARSVLGPTEFISRASAGPPKHSADSGGQAEQQYGRRYCND